MRKIYSIVLTACALLLSTSLFAAKTVTTAAELQQAINDGETNIVIGNDITVAAADVPITVYADPTKKITIDLNGKLISSSEVGSKLKLFWILKGDVEFTSTGNKGKIQINSTTTERVAIQVEGQGDPTVGKYSMLTIGKNVEVYAGNKGKAIVIDGTVTDFYPYITQEDLDKMTLGTYTADGGVVTNVILDRKGTESAQLYTYKSKKYNPANNITSKTNGIYPVNRFATYSQVDLTKTTLYKEESGTYTKVTTGTYYKLTGSLALAYGAEVTINGDVYGEQYGVKINGNLNKLDNVTDDNLPLVTISKDAVVHAHETNSDATGVYSSGYGKFEISGTVHGATGIYIKSGKVDLKDAIVKSDYTGDYTQPAGYRSGIDAGGSAIVIESNASYRGGQELKIEGDTKVEGGSGYAIEEAITTAVDTKVSSIVVEGGTIIAGGEGTAVVTAKTADNKVVEIVGGNIQDGGFFVKDDEGNNVPASADNFVPSTGYITTTIQDENGRTITVVTEGTAPQGEESVANANTASVNWIGTAETLDAPKNLDYLEINANKSQVLTVNEGVTLKVGRIVMGTQAQIIVKAGARLIVDGKQGIVAPVVSNIVLEANAEKYAQFLFNPDVESNRHPNATVEWISDSYRVSATDRLNQPFGIPTANKIADIYTDRTDHRVAFFEYDYDVTDDWVNIGYLNPENDSQTALDKTKLNKPFNFYQILCTSATPGTKVTMEGELVGNVNNTVDYLAHFYMGFANSYTADIDLATILPTVPGANEAVYIYRNDGYGWFWDPSSIEVMNVSKIAPMQAFVILNRGTEASSEINYKNFVWDPVMNPKSSAPARSSYDNKLQVRVVGQNATDRVTMIEASRFSTAFDKGEAEKYMNSGLNIYVTDETPMGIFASNDIDNTYLGFNCKKSGVYTLSFEQMAGEGLALVDLKNNTVVNIDNNATYNFTAEENEQNDYRFQIVKRQNVVTDVENVENGMKNGGIYTLTGMYLGNMSVWNTLPAGVYVVNGEKMVK